MPTATGIPRLQPWEEVKNTQDVADATGESYETTERKLLALEREGHLESTTFGGERVWRVVEGTDGDDDAPASGEELPTSTRFESGA